MQQLSADRIVRVHRAWRKFAFGLLERYENGVRLEFGRMEQSDAGLSGSLKRRRAQSRFEVVVPILGGRMSKNTVATFEPDLAWRIASRSDCGSTGLNGMNSRLFQ